MLKTMMHPMGFNSNVRQNFIEHPTPAKNALRAMPRDLGELPRNYALKLLLYHQPALLLDLWEACKSHDDVPFDSSKHLREVLKIARVQNWVYVEKNQTNNRYYYHIHPSKTAEVNAMIRADIVRKQNEEEAAQQQQKAQREADELRAELARDQAIAMLQAQLIDNLAKIDSFDPEFAKSHACVEEDGSINVAWHLRHQLAS
jgi:hypothetical protein